MPIIAIAHPRIRKHPVWVELQELLAPRVDLEVHYSEWHGHSSELARGLAPKEGVVIAVGGDGTFNEVLNGWMEQEQRGRPNFVLVPLGTGNDFARDQGLPSDPSSLAEMILQPAVKTFDLGRLTCWSHGETCRRYFALGATVGFSAEVTRFFQTLPRVLPGTAQYFFSLLVSLFRWRNAAAEITLDREIHKIESLFNLNVANTKFYGGGMYSSPRAVVDSGHLEAVIMPFSKLDVVRILPKTYSGDLDAVPGLLQQSVANLKIETEFPLPVQADGEYLGTTPVQVEVIPRALRLAMPREL